MSLCRRPVHHPVVLRLSTTATATRKTTISVFHVVCSAEHRPLFLGTANPLPPSNATLTILTVRLPLRPRLFQSRLVRCPYPSLYSTRASMQSSDTRPASQGTTLATVVAFIGEQLELHRLKHVSRVATRERREDATIEEGLDSLVDRREEARKQERRRREVPPLFIGVQGPQGCGALGVALAFSNIGADLPRMLQGNRTCVNSCQKRSKLLSHPIDQLRPPIPCP